MNEEKITFEYNNKLDSSGIWFLGRFFYSKLNLKRSLIHLDRNFLRIRRLISFIFFCIAALGVIAIAWWLYEERVMLLESPLEILTFWRFQHPLILVFLISIFFDLFLYYRSSVDKAAAIKFKNDDFLLDSKNGQLKKKTPFNLANTLDTESKTVLEEAFLLAAKLKQKELAPRHLFRALLKTKKVQAMFIRLGVSAESLIEKLDKYLADDEPTKNSPIPSQALQELLVMAALEALKRQQVATTVLDLAWPCYSSDPILTEILYDLNVDENKLQNVIAWLRMNERLVGNYHSYRRAASLKPGGNMNRSYTAVATPTLDHFSRDITDEARRGNLELCIDRTKEFNAIFDFFGSGHAGVLLVGPVGVGKKTIVEGLAQMMVEETVPEFLQDKRLIELDVSRLVSGASPADAQERLLTCLYDINRAGNIVLYISNIENLMGISSGDQESLDLAEVLADAVSRQALFCISTTTTENYSKFVEHSSLGNAMTTVGVSETNINQTIQILESKAAALESHYGIYLSYEAIEKAATFAGKYLHDPSAPLKAFNLLQKAVGISAQIARNNPDKSICDGEVVASALSEMTGIPVNKVSEDESQKLLNLENSIGVRMVGQEEAVKAVSASLRRARADLNDSARPIASFLFLGPTGVGKTELAKTVSQVYFGAEDYMVRLDMSEYQQPDSVSKMIGDASGTLGYLTEAVRKKPFSLVLLDEIEKAHPDILNLFLQLLDDGRLTDGKGRTISFSESIIIATSNIGSVFIQEEIKMGIDVHLIKQDLIDNQLNKYMRPELINRFDGIIVFKPLTEENIFSIATLMLKKIKKNLAEKGIDFKADKEGVLILAKAGYDPKFGARPLRRLLQERVEDELANLFLAGKLKRRDIVIINNNGNIEVEKGRVL
ncbi:MAG: ATP-dependent Clp protease ATP-binding subunit [Patescibacteria group bacterium]